MAKVSIHASNSNNNLIQAYAKDLSLFLNGISLSGVIGRNGGFERNAASQSSGIMKVHVKNTGRNGLAGKYSADKQDI